ncbi:ABC transporter ATP-binding protein [Natrarchaeobius sp. A-rgal3]|uniref:ABC transporter ATP-binding protein n=1 Tax=Natrarchaeobius versutus TaxID=1679078 RepID=UPI00350F0E5F
MKQRVERTASAPPVTDGDEIIEIRGLKKHFQSSTGLVDQLFGESTVVRAVDGVDLTIRNGETIAVVGESGCGKSTLAKTLLKLHEPTAGSITYRGTDLADLSQSEMRPFRREMQMILQDPLGSLNPSKTVGEIVTAPLEVHGIGSDSTDRRTRAVELLERVGLGADHFNRSPRQLSGGQQQRVGIARALAVEPEFLVADEPTSALDVSVQAKVLNLLDELTDEHGSAMLFIAHDLSTVRHIADRVAVMYLGEIVECAPVDELFDAPKHPYTKALLSAVPRINPTDRTERIRLDGTVPSPMDPPNGCRFHTRCHELVPPPEWTGTQEQFRRVFTFRTSVLSERIDVESLRTRASQHGEDVSTEETARLLLEEVYPGDPHDLPAETYEVVWSVSLALVENNEHDAKKMVRERFQTPCERNQPEHHYPTRDHLVRCHKHDGN